MRSVSRAGSDEYIGALNVRAATRLAEYRKSLTSAAAGLDECRAVSRPAGTSGNAFARPSPDDFIATHCHSASGASSHAYGGEARTTETAACWSEMDQ